MWSSAERATRQNWVLGQMAQVLTKDVFGKIGMQKKVSKSA